MANGTGPNTSAPKVAVFRLPMDDSKPERELSASPEEREWEEALMRQNAVWFCQLRWIVVAVLGSAGLAGLFPHMLESVGLALRPAWPLAMAGLLAVANFVFVRLAHYAGPRPARVLGARILLWAQIAIDLLFLTAVIHWLGSALPAAPFMYLFHIVLACIVFHPGESLVVAVLAASFYALCLVVEAYGVLPSTPGLNALPPGSGGGLLQRSIIFGVAPMLLIWFVIWHLVSRLAGRLRRRDYELALTNLRLQASGEERAKHMLQTTHQLKAPFAAIHAQTQLLLQDYCGALPQAARTVVEKIASRCIMLSRQIQEMLQLANLRSVGQSPPQRAELAFDNLVEEAVARVEPAARQRGIRIERQLDCIIVSASKDHLAMLLDNLIVNAVNYSYDHGLVTITCRCEEPGQALLMVRDRGIGIPAEKLPHIFDDYYRTDEAVQHNRASTGLGLAIVRQVAFQARLQIQVESAPGWGTQVSVVLPARTSTQNLPPKASPETHGNPNLSYGLSTDR